MNLDVTSTSAVLSRNLVAAVRLHDRPDGTVYVETPFAFSDGDLYSIYLRPSRAGGIRVTDRGHTLMHLSYLMDVDTIRDGAKGRAFDQVLREQGLSEQEGELYVEGPLDELVEMVFRFSHGVSRIADISFLNRIRTESVFYDQLTQIVRRLVGDDRVEAPFIPDIPQGDDYPVDIRVATSREPLFVFGIPGRDKARLVTALLEHMLRISLPFESLLVFLNQQDIPRRDLARLTNAGGEMVSSLDAIDDLQRKLKHRAA